MKITVKNLGVLRQAEFDLGDLTIICGGNNSGKTYATYALYGFLKTWRNYRGPMRQGRKIPKRSIEELMNDGVAVIDLTEYVRKAEAALDDMCNRYTDRLSNVFAAPRERFRDTRFRVSLDRDALSESVKSKSIDKSYGTRNRETFSIYTAKGSTELRIFLLVDKQGIKIPDFAIRSRIAEAIDDIIFGQFFPDTFISSAERTGAAIFRKELNFAHNRLLKEISQADDNVDPRELLYKSYQDYALPVENNVDFVRRLGNTTKDSSFLANDHPEILMWFDDVVGGAYRVTRNDELYFVPKNKQVRLDMDESSSSVRSLLDVGFYLRHVAKVGDLLIVDEPELNLHPENQRRVARLFARLVNLGVKVFLTTHSDYIVKELNTLIMLNHDEPYLKRIAEREGYESSELLAVEKVKVYVAEESLVQLEGNRRKSRCQTLVKADIDPELGIEVRSFDETINKMNEIQDAILWREGE